MKEPSPDRDQLLADQLARVHERMLDSAATDSTDEQIDDDLHDEQQVLDFIERVKRAGFDELKEVADPSTKRANLNETRVDPDRRPSSSEEKESDLPERIGRFDVVGLLGQGGYGVVYHAIDPELDRHVAIKIPRAEALVTPDLRSRFIREGKIAAAMSHPNIVTVHETGQQDAICFLVSELVEGITLADWISDQSEPVDQSAAAELISVLANALQHAHSRGVLHRDLKPANILLARTDTETIAAKDLAESAKISDFGLARYEGDVNSETRTGSMVGTPAYMSPEQMNESSKTIGPTTDIYALGCILYELLAGRRPFEAAGVLEMIQAVQKTDAKPIRAFRKDISRDLQAICLKCLEKDPARRYSTSHQLAEDLQRWLDGQPVLARHSSSIDRLAKWSRRNPALAASIVIIFVSITAGLCFSLWQWNRAERNLALAVEQRSQAERHMARVELVIDEMLTDVAKVLLYIPQMDLFRERLLRQAMILQSELVEENSDDARIRFRSAQALRRLTKIQNWLGEYKESIAAGTQATEILEDISADDIPQAELLDERLRVRLELCLPYYELNQLKSAETAVQEAIDILSDSEIGLSKGEQKLEMSRAKRSLGMILQQQNQRDDALVAFKEAEEAITDVPENMKSHSEAICFHYRILNSLGIISKSIGQVDESEKYYTKSIEINSAAVLSYPERADIRFDLAVTTLNFGNHLFRQKEYERALDSYRFCSETTEKLISDYPKAPRFRSMHIAGQIGLGAAYRKLDRQAEAIEVYQAAIAEIVRLHEDSRATPRQLNNLARTYNNLGLAYKDLGQTDDAVTAHQQGIKVLVQLVADNPDDLNIRLSLSIGQGNLGLLLLESGDPEQAKPVFLEALRIGEECLEINDAHSGVLRNLRWQHEKLSETYCRLGDHESAHQSIQSMIRFAEASKVHLKTAQWIARCVGIIQEGNDTTSDTLATASPYVDFAVEFIGKAIAEGNIEIDDIKQAEEFAPLREHEAFRALLDK